MYAAPTAVRRALMAGRDSPFFYMPWHHPTDVHNCCSTSCRCLAVSERPSSGVQGAIVTDCNNRPYITGNRHALQ